MSDEQQPQVTVVLPAQFLVVESSHDRLAGAGGGDEKVAVPAVYRPLDLQPLQHVALMRYGRTSRPDSVILRSAAVADDDPPAIANASCKRSPSATGSYVSKDGSLQYASKVASNLRSTSGVATDDSRTFHSKPSSNAVLDRLELPT